MWPEVCSPLAPAVIPARSASARRSGTQGPRVCREALGPGSARGATCARSSRRRGRAPPGAGGRRGQTPGRARPPPQGQMDADGNQIRRITRPTMPTEILMPALSPTMEEGKLAKWLVKEGQIIKAGDIIAEIETDKATMEVEAVDEGKVAKLLVAEGTEGVKVNTPIAVLDGEAAAAPAKS